MYCFLPLATDAESWQLAHVLTSEGNILQLSSHIGQKNSSVFTFVELYTFFHAMNVSSHIFKAHFSSYAELIIQVLTHWRLAWFELNSSILMNMN